jgi:hypothetical protein
VLLHLVRDGRSAVATTNRTDEEGSPSLPGAAEALQYASPNSRAGAARAPAEYPEVEGHDEQTAALGADDQRSAPLQLQSQRPTVSACMAISPAA